MKNFAIGADIGGSHITCQLFNLENFEVAAPKIRFPVNGNASKQEILDRWADAIGAAAGKYKLKSLSGIAFAMPGPFDYRNGIAWFGGVHKFDTLYGVNVRDNLQKKLKLPHLFPVRFLNDASCFAIGEAFSGVSSKFNKIIALTLGSGFGTTFIKNKLPVAGVNGVPDNGFLYQVPFKKSIADDYFSTRWFLKEYKKQTGKEIPGVKELAERAENNILAEQIFQIFGTQMGEFLSPWVKNFDAECIVIGGNISKSFFLFKNELSKQFEENNIQLTICQSTLGEDAALIGSSRLCDDFFYQKLIDSKII